MLLHDLVERVRSFATAWPADAEEIDGICWYKLNGIRYEKITVRSPTPLRHVRAKNADHSGSPGNAMT